MVHQPVQAETNFASSVPRDWFRAKARGVLDNEGWLVLRLGTLMAIAS
jgi:hypothetical protein